MTKQPNKSTDSLGKSRVSLIRCLEYSPEKLLSSLKKSLELINFPLHHYRGKKVLLKPNVMMPKKYGFPANTHPLFVAAVIKIFQEIGAEVVIGESSAGSQAGVTFTSRALKTSGLSEVAEKAGVLLQNFDLADAVKVKVPNPFVSPVVLAKLLFEVDLVVSLPKLKTHTFANIITGAIKNLYGCVPGQIKADYHRRAPRPEEFYTVVCDIYQIIKPGLTIFDGVVAMEGNGPSAGQPRNLGVITASQDGVAANAVVSQLIGVPPLRVLTTRMCAERSLGQADLEKIEIVGEKLAEVEVKDFKLPQVQVINPGLYRLILRLTQTQPKINHKKCTLCGICADSCPVGAISQVDQKMIIDYNQCIRCFCCAEVCPTQAITPYRRYWIGNWLSQLILRRW